MITPRFSCSQSEKSVTVSVYCPSVRASDVEINVDDTLFTLHINPYYLRLNFPHALQEDDEASAQYDPASGFLTVTLTKAVPGQDFEDLDLLAKLLAPRPTEQPSQGPLIEVLDSQSAEVSPEDDLVARAEGLSLEQQEILEAAANDWQLPQEVPEPLDKLKTTPQERYGFLDMYSGFFQHIQHQPNEINEIGEDVETCPPAERRKRRLQREEEKWDEDHYMADFVDDEYIQELLHWTHPHTQPVTEFQYTEAENMKMLRLPRKEYLATPYQTHQLYLTLLTLLFAYAYESRTTQQDPTPESGWTISSLVPAFTALDPPPYSPTPKAAPETFDPSELAATFTTSYRRSLAFPLFRSWALAERCRADVAAFLRGGKRMVVRCLLEMKDVLDHHEVYYVYSKIWVDDFCVWVQSASDEALLQLADAVASLKMEKSAVGWGLEELEKIAREDLDRSSDSDDESEDEVERMLPAPL
ncbi:SHQ1-domain-containing protein [Phanerochaete sordida]|uniref:SHQ1-domain-containing protein n=1 Tax=Phanerochaete sordida TaxID=48140 RepID=A0A9P3LAE0_9APHY|nr:SHQ1-domain-containing protein [Phanerochaete sordida]